jgi:transposase-like protein
VVTSEIVSPRKKSDGDGGQLSPEQAAAAAMVAEAKARGLELTGPHGLLKLFTKNVLETALNEEMTEHLGHEKNHADADRESVNVRNGSRGKTVVSDAAGEVRIEVPRDREGTFEPRIVKKRQRRLTEVDEIVLSLYAKGMTTGEISAHFAEIYGASVSKETVSRITDKVVAEMNEWATRPLDRGRFLAIVANHLVASWRSHCRMSWLGLLSFRHSLGRSLSSVAMFRS